MREWMMSMAVVMMMMMRRRRTVMVLSLAQRLLYLLETRMLMLEGQTIHIWHK